MSEIYHCHREECATTVAALKRRIAELEGEMSIECKHGSLARQCQICELEQRIDELKTERDAAFKMSGCECGAEECCQNLAKLDKRIAELESKIPRWIPLSERLPNPHEAVLAIKAGSTGKPYYAAMYRDKVWADIQSTYVIEVTHWMPLPDMPGVSDEFNRRNKGSPKYRRW